GTANAGEVVAVGYATVTKGGNTYNEPATVRYDASGNLDKSFAGTGEVILNLKNGGLAQDVVIQPDGRIVVAYSSGSTFNLARYNADGSLDTSFGPQGTGIVSTSLGKQTTGTAYSLALQPDGEIVVAGTVTSSTGTNLALARYTAGGLLDTSFGTGGIVTTQFASPVNVGGPKPIDLALDVSPLDPSAGKIVVVTELQSRPSQYVVVRCNANGSLDTSFAGGAGYEMLSNLNGVTPSVAIESSGDIIVVGNNTASGNVVELDSLNPNGTFNTAFGSGGIVVLSPPANTTYGAHDVAIPSDGQIVLAGN